MPILLYPKPFPRPPYFGLITPTPPPFRPTPTQMKQVKTKWTLGSNNNSFTSHLNSSLPPLTSLDPGPVTLTPQNLYILSYPSVFDRDWILEEIRSLLALGFGFVFLINLPFSISPINLSLLCSHPQMWLSADLLWWISRWIDTAVIFLIY